MYPISEKKQALFDSLGPELRFRQIFHEAMSNFLLSLEKIIHCPAQSGAITVRECSGANFVSSLPEIIDSSVYAVESLDSLCALSLDHKFIYCAVDKMFGNKAPIFKFSNQGESQVISKVRSRIFDAFALAIESEWGNYFPLRFAYLRQEKSPQNLCLFSDNDQIFSCDVSIDVGHHKALRLNFSLLKSPVMKALGDDRGGMGGDKWHSSLDKSIGNSRLDLVAELADIKMSVEEFSHIHIGQVLDIEVGDDVVLKLGGENFGTAKSGTNNGFYAVKIQEIDSLKSSASVVDQNPNLL